MGGMGKRIQCDEDHNTRQASPRQCASRWLPREALERGALCRAALHVESSTIRPLRCPKGRGTSLGPTQTPHLPPTQSTTHGVNRSAQRRPCDCGWSRELERATKHMPHSGETLEAAQGCRRSYFRTLDRGTLRSGIRWTDATPVHK